MPKEERSPRAPGRGTQNIVQAAGLFVEIAASNKLDERTAKKDRLKALEHEGDLITREIFEALNTTFITPLDREDISMIAGDLDDILDYMESVSHNLVLFELQDSPEPLRQFARILGILVEQIDTVTKQIWDLSNARGAPHIMRISELENEADTLYRTVIAISPVGQTLRDP